MRIAYLANVYVHVLAAMVWIGGSAFIALVLAPLMRRGGSDVPALRAAALRFRTVGWISLALLVATGIGNLAFRGVAIKDLSDGSAFRGSAGHALACKLILVAVMLAISGFHDFRWGPAAVKAMETDPASSAAARGRRLAGRVGRFVFLLGLLIVAAAIIFTRGGL